MALNPYGNVARSVARVGVGKAPRAVRARPYRAPKVVRPPRPPRLVKPPATPPAPTTQTPTLSGTGVTTTSGGQIPGAPDNTGMPAAWQAPKIKNWNKATAAQIAQSMLAPQYASLYAAQHQDQLMAGQQQAAITGMGAELAKILGQAGPNGVKATLPPEYAAALAMQNLRHFAYQQFLTTQKYADDAAKIAAQYPTYLKQMWDQKFKQANFQFQKLVATQTYHLNTQKANAYNAATGARLQQSQARINLSRQQYNLAVAKANQSAAQYNLTRQDKLGKIDLQLSKAAGKWVNSNNQVLKNVPFKNPPPPYYKPNQKKPGQGQPPQPGSIAAIAKQTGLSPNEVAGWQTKAAPVAHDLYTGFYEHDSKGNPTTYHPPRNYNWALRYMVRQGFPKAIAQSILGRYYKGKKK